MRRKAQHRQLLSRCSRGAKVLHDIIIRWLFLRGIFLHGPNAIFFSCQHRNTGTATVISELDEDPMTLDACGDSDRRIRPNGEANDDDGLEDCDIMETRFYEASSSRDGGAGCSTSVSLLRLAVRATAPELEPAKPVSGISAFTPLELVARRPNAPPRLAAAEG